MRQEIIWEKSTSFSDKTYKLSIGPTLYGLLNCRNEFGLSYICKFKTLSLELKGLKAVDLNLKSTVCNYFNTKFNEYTIIINEEKYIYNKICEEIFDTHGKTLITVEKDSWFFPKRGVIKIDTDKNVELLISSLFYLRTIYGQE
jgi:hypothetical protein